MNLRVSVWVLVVQFCSACLPDRGLMTEVNFGQ